MTGTIERAWDRLAIGAWVGVAVLAVGYVGLAAFVLRMVGVEHRRSMQSLAGVEAQEAERHLTDVVDELRRMASEMGAAHAVPDGLAAVPHGYGDGIPLVRALVLVGADGAVRGASPPGWLDAHQMAALPSLATAATGGGVWVGPPVALGDGTPAFFIVMAIPPGAAAGVGRAKLAAVVDLRAFRSRYLQPMLSRAGEWSVLFGPDAAGPAIIAGDESGAHPPGTGIPAASWQRMAAGGPARIETADGAYLVSDPARLSIGASRWSLVLLRPYAAALGDARRVLLLSGFFFIVALAVASAMAVAWRRRGQTLRTIMTDARRWREIAGEVQREERWRIISEEAWEPIVFLRGTRVEAANLAAVECLHLSERGALLGAEFSRFVADEDRGAFAHRVASLGQQTDGKESFRCAVLTAGGDRRVAEMTASVVAATSGRMVRLSWRDLTSRERAEALLRTVSGAVPVGVVLLDPMGRLVWANAVAATAVRHSVESFLGRPVMHLVDRRDRRRALALVARAARGDDSEGLIHVRAGGGELVPLAVRAVAVHVAGALDGVLLVAWDSATVPTLSGWERLPDGVLLRQLATFIAHRLNNDLQALVGIVGKIPELAETSEHGGEARRLVQRAAHLIQQFGVLSRLATPVRQQLGVGALVEAWASRVRPGLPAGVRLLCRCELDDDRLDVDSAQFTLLLDLALSAALPELSRGGAFEVSVEAGPQPGILRLALSDTGTAEPPAPHEERDAAPWPAAPAREMVEAVARVVARHHHGAVGAKSTVALGHRLWCDLPRHVSARREARDVAPKEAGVVLVADDEDLVRAAIADALRDVGYVVEEVADGRQAVDAVAADAGRYTLVILDLVMPVMDGREALCSLREIAPGLPVLVCTGYDPVDDPVLGTASVVIKPLTGSELVERVAALIAARHGSADDGTMSQ